MKVNVSITHISIIFYDFLTIAMNVLEIMKEVGRRWKSLSADQKQEFEKKAKEDKKRFDLEMSDFNKEINKVSIVTTKNKRRESKDQHSDKSNSKPVKSKRGRKKGKKTSDPNRDYVYSGRPNDELDEPAETKPKCEYLLRRRNRNTKKILYTSESEESEDSEDDKISYNRYKSHQNVNDEEESEAMQLEKPKKPLSAFLFYSQFKKDQSKKEISNTWSNLSHEEKEPYEQMAKEDKVRFEAENKLYKAGQQKQATAPLEFNDTSRVRHMIGHAKMHTDNIEIDYFKNKNISVNKSLQNPGDNKITISVNVDKPQIKEEEKETKRERRSKKIFDYNHAPIQAQQLASTQNTIYDNKDDKSKISSINITKNDPPLEHKMSNFSSSKYMMNDEKIPDLYKQSSFNFAFNEEEPPNPFANKDSPPDCEFVSPFAMKMPNDNEKYFQDEPRPNDKNFGLSRQDSNKFAYRGYDNPNWYQFNQFNASFKSDFDFGEPGFNKPMGQSSFINYGNNIDFKFSPNNPNIKRMIG